MISLELYDDTSLICAFAAGPHKLSDWIVYEEGKTRLTPWDVREKPLTKTEEPVPLPRGTSPSERSDADV